jgi:hypothetical protein
MKFSDKTIDKAIKSLGNELAWKKEDVFQAIDELIENKCAILGGDVWAVVKNNINLSKLTQVDAENIAIGIIRGKDGQDYVYNWYSNKRQGESWDEYVLRSKIETIESINKMNAEQTVAEEFKNFIYYNLVFADNIEFENLKH